MVSTVCPVTSVDDDVVDLDEPRRRRSDGMPAPRWEPDFQLVPAVMSLPHSPKHLTEYSKPDQCWLVAGLTLAGWSVAEIEDRCGGSERLIKGIRAEPMTELCKLMQTETGRLSDELRLEHGAHVQTVAELTVAIAERDRLRVQHKQLVKALKAKQGGELPCGCPNVPYNVYENGGRTFCRECGRKRLKRWRDKARSA